MNQAAQGFAVQQQEQQNEVEKESTGHVTDNLIDAFARCCVTHPDQSVEIDRTTAVA